MKGPRPKPTIVKKRAGNPGKRPLNKHEARIPREMPKCPSHLTGEARRAWNEMAPRTYTIGLLAPVQAPAFACLCQAIATNAKATRMIAKQGEVVYGVNGTMKQNPWVTIAKNAKVEILRFSAEFGITPSSQSRATAADMEQMSLAELLFAEAKSGGRK